VRFLQQVGDDTAAQPRQGEYEPIHLDRRQTLQYAIALSALGIASAFRWKDAGPEGLKEPSDTVAARAASLFSHSEEARRIGASYLLDRPEEADTSRLVMLLLRDARPDGTLVAIDQCLANAIDRDWRDGSLVVISGWVFAAAEVRLCALGHLGAQQA
jgi:hypothetical protein